MRRLAFLAVLFTTLAVTGTAHAAAVTAVDVSVRPAEGSPWSKGTLFKGEGFQVGATTGNGWAYGRAKGSAERCGWVLISELSSTTRTDTTCGDPKTEPLEDSEHVAGGGPSERWYVTCESATLFGNYGGAAGNLRSAASTVTLGTPVGWRYTTGNGYAASIDGPTGTPRFILRSCISRTPPGGGPAGDGPAGGDPAGGDPAGDEGLIGPDPFTVLDEDILFDRFGGGIAGAAFATAAESKPITVKRTRATIRIAPNNLIVANGLRGDRFTPGRGSCKGYAYGTITRGGTNVKHTGWVQVAGLSRRPRVRGGCGRVLPYGDRIGFVNAPSRSVTYRRKTRAWTTTGSASSAYLTAGCQLHMNYTPGVGLQDPVTGPVQQWVFKNGDNSSLGKTIGYRYTTADGQAALVTTKSGYVSISKKGKRREVGLWGFVSRGCVVPTKTRGGTANTVYQPEIRICDGRVLPSRAVKTLNRGGKKQRSKRIRRVSPCRMANKPSNPGRPKPDNLRDGWNFGKVR